MKTVKVNTVKKYFKNNPDGDGEYSCFCKCFIKGDKAYIVTEYDPVKEVLSENDYNCANIAQYDFLGTFVHDDCQYNVYKTKTIPYIGNWGMLNDYWCPFMEDLERLYTENSWDKLDKCKHINRMYREYTTHGYSDYIEVLNKLITIMEDLEEMGYEPVWDTHDGNWGCDENGDLILFDVIAA